MKKLLLILTVILAIVSGIVWYSLPRDVPDDALLLGIAYEREAKCFLITLTNQCDHTISVEVNTEKYFGSVYVISEDEKMSEYFVDDYRNLLLTSIWVDPTITMRKGEAVSWRVPLKELKNLKREHLSGAELNAIRVYAESDRMTALPHRNNTPPLRTVTIQIEQVEASDR